MRNACTSLIRYTKACYWKTKFLASDSPKSFWSVVKEFSGASNIQRVGPLKDEDDMILTNDAEKANLLNSFFCWYREEACYST